VTTFLNVPFTFVTPQISTIARFSNRRFYSSSKSDISARNQQNSVLGKPKYTHYCLTDLSVDSNDITVLVSGEQKHYFHLWGLQKPLVAFATRDFFRENDVFLLYFHCTVILQTLPSMPLTGVTSTTNKQTMVHCPSMYS
jgi:hypothetical protein